LNCSIDTFTSHKTLGGKAYIRKSLAFSAAAGSQQLMRKSHFGSRCSSRTPLSVKRIVYTNLKTRLWQLV